MNQFLQGEINFRNSKHLTEDHGRSLSLGGCKPCIADCTISAADRVSRKKSNALSRQMSPQFFSNIEIGADAANKSTSEFVHCTKMIDCMIKTFGNGMKRTVKAISLPFLPFFIARRAAVAGTRKAHASSSNQTLRG